eukprot:c20681_g1_i10.p1 GENE.c20681_g1_i10~~c20681_g1_i10.p1  ORF type:complete len:146 (-),score=29.31 c20681_g1_i10:88-525(-)
MFGKFRRMSELGLTELHGTIPWVSPGSGYGSKCDIFSFGVLLWEIATCADPFETKGGNIFGFEIIQGYRLPLDDIQGLDESRVFFPPCFDMPKVVEKSADSDWFVDEALKELIAECWSADPHARPNIDVVLDRLRLLKTALVSNP